VVDTCGYLPRDVACMAECLQGRVGRYVFVSSISVYASFEQPNDERSPLGCIADVDTDMVDSRTYGPLKALCEQAVASRFGDRALLTRPGLIVGPHDPTQRFTYWPARAAAAGCRPSWAWAAPADVERCGLEAWSDLPVWVPAVGEHAAFALTDTRAAQAAGLTIRPLAQTVADTLAWHLGLPADQQVFSKAGLSPEREAAALDRLLRR